MKTLKSTASLTFVAASLLLAPLGCATHERAEHMQAAANDSYPLTKCVVSGEDLGDKPYVFTHNGQTVKLCCKDCLAKFNAEPDKYMAKINQPK